MNSTEIIFEFKGTFVVAPIDQHYVLEHLTKLLKEVSELERIDCNNGDLITNLSLKYIPHKER